MSYDPVLHILGDHDEDDDQGDGLSPWARERRQTWSGTLELDGIRTPETVARAHRRFRRTEKQLAHREAHGDGLSPWGQAWEARKLRELDLTDVPGHATEHCSHCNEDAAPPPSGVRPRLRPTAAPESERRPRKHPRLKPV